MRLALALLTLPLVAQTTYYLRNPATQPRYIGSAIGTTTPAQITFDPLIPPNWSAGQRAFCNASVGTPALNGFVKVKTAINGYTFTFTDFSDVDIPASATATQQD